MKRFFQILPLVFVGLLTGLSQAADNKNSWNVICQDNNSPSTCRMEQNLFLRQTAEDGQEKSGKILGVTILYVTDQATGERKPHMNFLLPLGVDLRAGIVFRVDEKEEISLRYLTCTQRGCETALPVSDALLEGMLDGGELQVGFRGWGAKQTNVVKVTLIGFTRAFSSLG